MAKILVQFNEGTSRTESQNNITNRVTSFNNGTEKEMIFKTAAGGFMRFPSAEALLTVFNSSELGFSSTSYTGQSDVRGALENLDTRVKNIDLTPTLTTQQINDLGTGYQSGGAITNALGFATFDMASVNFYRVNNYSNASNPSNSGELTALSIINVPIEAGAVTFIYVDTDDTIKTDTVDLSCEEMRDKVHIATLIHPAGLITNIVFNPVMATDTQLNLADTMFALERLYLKGLNYVGASTNNLSLLRGSGTVFVRGASSNAKCRNLKDIADLEPAPLFPFYENAGVVILPVTNFVDPEQYNPGGVGALASVPNNNWQVQRIFFDPRSEINTIAYGQNVYPNMDDAINATINGSDSFVTTSANIDSVDIRSFLIVQEGTTNLNNSVDAFFFQLGKYGDLTASTSASITTFQQVYLNSVQPQIVINNAQGALQIESGTGDDLDNIFEILGNTSLLGFSVNGRGDVSARAGKFDFPPNASTPTLESSGTFIVSGADTLTGTPPDGLFISRSNIAPPGSRAASIQNVDNSGVSPIVLNGELNVLEDMVIIQDDLGIGTFTPKVPLHVDPNNVGIIFTPAIATTALFHSNTTGSGVSILGNASDDANIFFGDNVTQTNGRIKYNNSTDKMSFFVTSSGNPVEAIEIDTDKGITLSSLSGVVEQSVHVDTSGKLIAVDVPVNPLSIIYKATTSSQAAPPSSGRIEWNNATQINATELYIHGTSDIGNSVQNILLSASTDDEFLLYDGPSGNFQKWSISSVTDNTTYVTFGVSLVSSSHAFLNNATMAMILLIEGSGGGGGSTTFTGLTDTPSSYAGEANKIVSVNAGETALEFTAAPAVPDKLQFQMQFADMPDSDLANQDWLYSWSDESHGVRRSGTNTGLQNGTASPIIIPFDGTITNATGYVGKAATNQSTATASQQLKYELYKVNISGITTLDPNFDFTFTGGSWGVNQAAINVDRTSNEKTGLSISVSRGDKIGIRWDQGSGTGELSNVRMVMVNITVEKD